MCNFIKKLFGIAIAFFVGVFSMGAITLTAYANDKDGEFKKTLDEASEAFKK